MANGAAVALHLAFEPAKSNDAPIEPTVSKPNAGIEDLIGEVLAGLADTSVQAYREASQEGGLSKATRAQGGELIALLYEARQALGEVEFDAVAHRQGQLRLRRPDAALSPAVLDEITDELIAIVVRVDATMKAMAH